MPLPVGAPAPDGSPPGPAVLMFFKNGCPTCQMAVPVYSRLARRYGDAVPVVAVAQDPEAKARPWLDDKGFAGPLVDDSEGYPLSDAFRIATVPTLVLVADGKVLEVSEGWDRDRANRWDQALSARSGVPSPGPVSTEADGLPVFKPG